MPDHDDRSPDIVYDYEHHVDHLVVHPYDEHYLVDPIHNFILVRPDDHIVEHHHDEPEHDDDDSGDSTSRPEVLG
jgi:hypothetical protein